MSDRKSAEKPRVKWVGEEEHQQIATTDQIVDNPEAMGLFKREYRKPFEIPEVIAQASG